MLEAEQAMNVAILKGRGRPSPAAALVYARSARNAGQWQKAAEMFEAVEQLEPGSDHASTIDYCYAMAKDWKRSEKWSRVAYQRSPTALTAYNNAISSQRGKNVTQYERLMEESLRKDPSFTPTLCVYGHYLMDKSDQRGLGFITRAFDLLRSEMRSGSLDDGERSRLRRCAQTLGKTAVIKDLEKEPLDTRSPDRQYSEENLVRALSEDTRKG
jgi:hypothetical protein